LATSAGAIARLDGKPVLPILGKRAICKDGPNHCDVVRDGRPLYRDTRHLDRWGSQVVIEYFQAEPLGFLEAGTRHCTLDPGTHSPCRTRPSERVWNRKIPILCPTPELPALSWPE